MSPTLLAARSNGYAAAVDAREVAFAGAAEQARMLADGQLTAPELL
jgi:amidase